MTKGEQVLQVAMSYFGLEEQKDRKQLMEAGLGVDPSTTPWCAAFVNLVLRDAGLDEFETGSNLARSFLTQRKLTKVLNEPLPGDIVIFRRGTQPWQGHVGFVYKVDERDDSKLTVLGGNQRDAVTLSQFSTDGLLGIRRVS